jgi:hypothetical protein
MESLRAWLQGLIAEKMPLICEQYKSQLLAQLEAACQRYQQVPECVFTDAAIQLSDAQRPRHQSTGWSDANDVRLLIFIHVQSSSGSPDWDIISAHFGMGSPEECQARWETVLDPTVIHSPQWTDDMNTNLRALTKSPNIDWETVARRIGRPISECKQKFRQLSGRPPRFEEKEAKRSAAVRRRFLMDPKTMDEHKAQIRRFLGSVDLSLRMLRKMHQAVIDRRQAEPLPRDCTGMVPPLLLFVRNNVQAVGRIRDEFVANGQTDDERQKARTLWDALGVANELLPVRKKPNRKVDFSESDENAGFDESIYQEPDWDHWLNWL